MKHQNILFIAILLIIAGCDSAPQKKQASGYAQGTTYSVNYYSEGTDYQYQIDSVLLAFDRALSTYQDQSYISKWNRNEADSLEVPADFDVVVKRAIEINEMTDGLLDITIAPIFSYWFNNDWNVMEFEPLAIDSIMRFVGAQHIGFQDGRLSKDDPRVQLDVNAIAQGYSVDVVADFLEDQGITNYLVEIGGEVRAKGKKDDGSEWKVGIERPDQGANADRAIQVNVPLNDRSMATSGNYRKFLEKDGEKLGHVIDPNSGYPAKTDMLSATIIADDCMTADALATACLIMNFVDAKKFVESNTGLDAVLIYTEGGQLKTWMSEGIDK